MAKTKGTDVMALKSLLRDRGPKTEQDFRETLTPEMAQLFDSIMAFSWTPVEQQAALYDAAARFLFPNDPDAIINLGKTLARRTYSGIYKIFLRIPTISFIISRTAQVWSSYYDKGEASVQKVGDKSAHFIVKNFPDLPLTMRTLVISHVSVLLESAGAKHIEIHPEEKDPNEWKWLIGWK